MSRVLYIDDDAGLRRLAERSLKRRGYQVTLAERGADGVALAAAEPFDLVAVDHYMPGMDGLETLEQLRALPNPPPESVDDLADWVQQQLALDRPASRVREERAKPVAWGDKTLQQPAHWMMSFSSPRMNVQADYWVGSNMVNVRRSESNFFAMLNNLHKGVGMGVGWVLLADTMAGSILLLSITGVILWTQLNRRRLAGALIVGASLATVMGLIFSAI